MLNQKIKASVKHRIPANKQVGGWTTPTSANKPKRRKEPPDVLLEILIARTATRGKDKSSVDASSKTILWICWRSRNSRRAYSSPPRQ